MFEKHNFINNLALGTILAFVLGFTLQSDWMNHGISFAAAIVGLQVAALGYYCLFIENELLNTHAHYQVFIIALITGYQVVRSIEHQVNSHYDVYIHHINLAWGILAVIIHTRCPEVLIKALRFNIGYTISILIVRLIPVVNVYSEIISLIVGIGFIFVLHLTFNRIAVYSSIYLYSFMIVYGLMTVIDKLPFHYKLPAGVLIGADVLTGILFAGGLYLHCRQNNSGSSLLGGQASYNTFGAEA
ncbi:hypothetical protein CONCODRAFT_12911 [Conidiobolus coronatus NRRL 28638]|uniref:Uncharacterized protein n=1 Tax=Conidiobolus coronatus (strain ATCC 28846 / CBS 209.66 / NRRL 28638) TaxID=796925 RepID=A0A137NRV7_CONC2|nr:hypothetical protein CONCODRAFT_12911 [Conidiobolus coronatus NRRL 28638]|eukprot:KXN65485.1 hypothetical protein CONCODRAFT_12911 [Conidiobolus coronatus NRRL 28638]